MLRTTSVSVICVVSIEPWEDMIDCTVAMESWLSMTVSCVTDIETRDDYDDYALCYRIMTRYECELCYRHRIMRRYDWIVLQA